MSAPFRPTHRVEIYYAGYALPVLYDVRVDGRYAYPRDEPTVPLLELRDGLWHYVRGEPITRGPEVQGIPGRRARSDTAATVDITLRFGKRRVTLHVTEDERAILLQAAGEQGLAAWARDFIGDRQLTGAWVRDLLLAKASK